MDFSVVRQRLFRSVSLRELEQIMDYIELIFSSFVFANIDLTRVSVYLVLRNPKGFKLFKTIDNHIVVDKLDPTFIESRELIGLAPWSFRGIYRIRYDGQTVLWDRLKLADLSRVLFSLVEPKVVKYVAGLEEGNTPVLLSFSKENYGDVDYHDLRSCMLASYLRSLRLRGEEMKYALEPNFYVVDYV